MRRLAHLGYIVCLVSALACSGKNGSPQGSSSTANAPTATATPTPVIKAATKPGKSTASTSASTAARATPIAIPDGPGTVKRGRFHSKALGVDKEYVVYLPAGYDANKRARYPVIYYLHGLGGKEGNWARNLGLAKQADAMKLGAIVVMPDGDDSFYVNAVSMWQPYERCLKQRRPFGREKDMKRYCVRQPRYEDYMTKDLVQHVDATYRTLGTRAGRGIAGLSMGGYGALMLSMRHQQLFSAAASHSGVDSLLYKGPRPYVKGKVELTTNIKAALPRLGVFGVLFKQIYGTDLEHWRAHDPTTLAKKLEPGQLQLYLDCGTEDEFALQHGASYLHEILEAKKIPHEFYLGPGKHNGDFWRERVGHSLRFFKKHLAAASAPQ